MAEKLGRRFEVVFSHTRLLGLQKDFDQKKWSEREIKFLKNNYRTMPKTELAYRLNRNISVINGKMHKLGLLKLTKPVWIEKEKKFLLENYGYIRNAELAKNLKRSVDAIRKMSVELLSQEEIKNRKWKMRHRTLFADLI